MKHPTSKDIARKPGVSVHAVFSSHSGRPDVGGDRQPRAESPARELRTHSGTFAKSLRHKQIQAIGAAIPQLRTGLIVLKSI